MLMDLRDSELTGKLAQDTLERAGVTANRNTVPFDTRSPFVTSGVRIGTPAVTTRGMKEPEMGAIADLIRRALALVGDDEGLGAIAAEVRELCERFPSIAGTPRRRLPSPDSGALPGSRVPEPSGMP